MDIRAMCGNKGRGKKGPSSRPMAKFTMALFPPFYYLCLSSIQMLVTALKGPSFQLNTALRQAINVPITNQLLDDVGSNNC